MKLATFIPLPFALTATTATPILRQDHSHYNFPNPEPCLGNCSWIHDPSIIKKDDTYYRFSTSGNIAIATAPALTGPWEYIGSVLDQHPKIQISGVAQRELDVWAPDVILINSTYYLFYSVSKMGLQTSEIGVATSTALLPGSWLDHGSLNLPQSPSYNLIDPHLFIDPDVPVSPLYFTFGSYWDDIFQTTLPNPPLGYDGSAELANIVSNTTVHAAVAEGAFTIKYEGLWYVFFSVGQCCRTPPELAAPGDEYRVLVCRSEEVEGPYVDAEGRDCRTGNGGTLVLGSHGEVYAPGGQGVTVIEEGEDGNEGVGRPVLYYHYVNNSIGYEADQFQFGVNYLDFESGWPVVV